MLTMKMLVCIAAASLLLASPAAIARKIAGMAPLDQSREFYVQAFEPQVRQQLVQGSIDDLLKASEVQAKSRWQDQCPEMQPALSAMLHRELLPSLDKMMSDPALADKIIAAMQATISGSERIMIATALDSGNNSVATYLIYSHQAFAREVAAIIEDTLRTAQPELMELVKKGSLTLRPIAEVCDARVSQGQGKE